MVLRIIILLHLLILTSCTQDNLNKSSGISKNDKANRSIIAIKKENNEGKDNILDKKTSLKKPNKVEHKYYKEHSNIYYDKEYEQVEIKSKNDLFVIKLIDYQSYISFISNGNHKNDYLEVDFNYIYGEDIDSAIKKINKFKVKKGNEGILILPSATEEYPSYTAVLFNNSGIKNFFTLIIKNHTCNDFDIIKFNNNKQIHVIKNNHECNVEIIKETPVSSPLSSSQLALNNNTNDKYYDYSFFKNMNDYYNSKIFKEVEAQQISDLTPSFHGEKEFSFGGKAAIGRLNITNNNDVTILMCGDGINENCSIEYHGKYEKEMKNPTNDTYSITGNRIILKHAEGSIEISKLN